MCTCSSGMDRYQPQVKSANVEYMFTAKDDSLDWILDFCRSKCEILCLLPGKPHLGFVPYLCRTAPFRRSDQLFIAYGRMRKGRPVTKPTIARWISSAMIFCHQQAGKPLQSSVRAHSTRAMSSSTALFAGVPLRQICRAATWSNRHTFTKHYCLDAINEVDTAVGQAVLRHLFN
ncbi:uncharacterized protein LOC144780831 [Lissotriton helveticus]